MKKLYALLLMGIAVLGATACAEKSSGSTSTKDPAASGIEKSQQDQESPSATSRANVSDKSNSIIVKSSEEVTVIPDIAEVAYSVRTEAREAAACQQQNTESVSQVIELLKGLGIEESSIQTSNYYMDPVYDYSGNTARLTGYQATATLTVSDIPIDSLDNILSQSVMAGINTIQSITYQASKYDESYQAALAAAVETAYQKAQVLAKAAGCNVGHVINIQETSGYSEARYTDSALANTYRSAAKEELSADTAGIMPGEIKVEASLIVEYQLY